jgi:uncharacterized protein YndB with AHSA1/START domain
MNDLVARAEVTIDAPAENVWRALTEPELIAQYMFGSKVTTDWKVGSPITYEGEFNGNTYRDKGTILEVIANKTIKSTHFSVTSGKPDVPENYNVVTYDLVPRDGGTVLKVTQENNPDRAMVEESEKTWGMMLKGLKKVVEGLPPS